jgi:hypothetical protein
MPQESVSPETLKVGKALSVPSHKGGLKRKIITTFSGLILVLGFLVIGVVYYLTGNALRKQVDLRATAIATNLSDAAAGIVSRKSAGSRCIDREIRPTRRRGLPIFKTLKEASLRAAFNLFHRNKGLFGDCQQPCFSSRVANMRRQAGTGNPSALPRGQLRTAHVGLWLTRFSRRYTLLFYNRRPRWPLPL